MSLFNHGAKDALSKTFAAISQRHPIALRMRLRLPEPSPPPERKPCPQAPSQRETGGSETPAVVNCGNFP
jgi:hypothetical protein